VTSVPTSPSWASTVGPSTDLKVNFGARSALYSGYAAMLAVLIIRWPDLAFLNRV
jgi:hypothetical protein